MNKRKYSTDSGISCGSSSRYSDDEDYTTESYSSDEEVIDLCTPPPAPVPRPLNPPPLRREKRSRNLLEGPPALSIDDVLNGVYTQPVPDAESPPLFTQETLTEDELVPMVPIPPLDYVEEPVPTQVLHVEPHPETDVEVCNECLYRMINQCRYPVAIKQVGGGSYLRHFKLTFDVMKVPCGHLNRKPWLNN